MHSLTLGIWGRAAGQGMVFWPCCPKQGIQYLTCLCPKQGIVFRAERPNPDCEQSLSFLSLQEVRLKEHAIERRTTSGVFLFLISL